MNAIHIIWTKPFYAGGGASFYMDDFDILTGALSALKWRQHNGDITVVTDTFGAAYLKRTGLDCLWNEVKVTLDGITVNPRMFWAAGKLYALSRQNAPCVMLDTDFIVWHGIDFDAIAEKVGVIHTEELYHDVYPPTEYFKTKNGYRISNDLDRSVKPCNTAFLYINDNDFLKYYTKTAMEFMENSADCDDTLTYMVFAEQRLLSMCAKKAGEDIFVFSDLEKLFSGQDRYFTHTWGFKQQMRENPDIRYDFCRRCAARIKKDFPEYAQKISGVSNIKKYF